MMATLSELHLLIDTIKEAEPCTKHDESDMEICTECLTVQCGRCCFPCRCWNDE